jgi:Ca-activated chloride channel homolog
MHPRFSRSRRCALVLVVALVLVLSAQINGVGPCRAADVGTGNLIFILDASGSMAAQVQGRIKIDVAKEVLSSLIKDLPMSANVGLVAYGHRQKGDCSDVQELSPLGPINKEELISAIGGIHPKGMTPITFSVQKVAEGLKGIANETTIILVSDGEETCKGDPCALVRELKASGIKFVMHVIGFDVNEKQKAQLSCIARAGGGTYFTARNAAELSTVAKKVVEKTEPSTGTLSIKATSYAKPLRAYSEIYKNEGEDDKGKAKVAEGWLESGSRTFQLTPGAYDIRIENREDPAKPNVGFQGIEIESGKVIEKVADFSGGILKVKVFRNRTPSRAYCAVYKKEGTGEQEKEKVTENWTDVEAAGFKLAPGRYDVMVEDREDANKPAVNFQGVAIEAGKTIEKVAEFSGGTLRIKALRNNEPLRAYCVVYKAGGDEDKEAEKVTEGRVELESTSFNFTPGVYDVIVENQEDPDKPTVIFPGLAIEAGKTLEKVADFSGGVLKVSALRNGAPFSAGLYVDKAEEDGSKKRERLVNDYTGTGGKTYKLPPGVYDITVVNHEDAGRPVLSFPSIVIEVGKTVEKVADFSGGSLKVSALRNGAPLSVVLYVDKAEQGADKKKERVVNDHTGTGGKTYKLPPGVYDITVVNHEDAGRPSLSFPGVTIEAGKTVEKVADFSGGSLKVSALRNGTPFSVVLYVDKAEQGADKKKERVVNDHTGTGGKTYKLPPGVYDITAVNHEDAGRPSLSFPGVTIEAGKTIEKVADFSGGSLKVSALRNGAPFSVVLYVDKAEQGADKKKERVVNDHTGTGGKTYKLPPGVYDITVVNHEDAGRPSLSFPGVTIEAGKTVDKVAEFAGGAVKLSATKSGNPLSAQCFIDRAEEGPNKKKERVVNDHTGTGGKTYKLAPGVYDITVVNHSDPQKATVRFSGITIEPGKTVEKEAQF